MNGINVEVLQTLASTGMKLLWINERIYVTDWFESATATMLKHKIKGRDVTSMIVESSQFVQGHVDQLALAQFTNKVLTLPLLTIEFHNSIKFVYYA